MNHLLGPRPSSTRRGSFLLAAPALLCALLSGAAHAEDSASLVLRGVVPLRCDIEVSAPGSLLELRAGASELAVGAVTERCNSTSGYTVSVSSRGNGHLVGPSDSLAYRLLYGDARADLSASRGAAVEVSSSDALTAARGVERPLRIALDRSGELAGGLYEDTLIFTIAAR